MKSGQPVSEFHCFRLKNSKIFNELHIFFCIFGFQNISVKLWDDNRTSKNFGFLQQAMAFLELTLPFSLLIRYLSMNDVEENFGRQEIIADQEKVQLEFVSVKEELNSYKLQLDQLLAVLGMEGDGVEDFMEKP